jgi:heme oxygenase
MEKSVISGTWNLRHFGARNMSDDWEAGDLALCVNTNDLLVNGWLFCGDGLALGRLYTVEHTRFDYLSNVPVLHLLDDPDEGNGRYARRFIKVTPDEADEEGNEITRAPIKEDA